MNDIKRYEYIGHSCDGIEPDNDGEFVKFDDYEKRVNGQLRLLEVSGRYNEKLEKRIAELEQYVETQTEAVCRQANKLRKIRDTVSMFNNGIQILSCDGNVILSMSEYNALVNAINEGEE